MAGEEFPTVVQGYKSNLRWFLHPEGLQHTCGGGWEAVMARAAPRGLRGNAPTGAVGWPPWACPTVEVPRDKLQAASIVPLKAKSAGLSG